MLEVVPLEIVPLEVESPKKLTWILQLPLTEDSAWKWWVNEAAETLKLAAWAVDATSSADMRHKHKRAIWSGTGRSRGRSGPPSTEGKSVLTADCSGCVWVSFRI